MPCSSTRARPRSAEIRRDLRYGLRSGARHSPLVHTAGAQRGDGDERHAPIPRDRAVGPQYASSKQRRDRAERSPCSPPRSRLREQDARRDLGHSRRMKSGAFCVGRTHKHDGSGELTEAAVFARQAAWRDARTMASSIGRERRGALRGVLGTLHLPPSLRDVSHAFGAPPPWRGRR